MFFIAWKNLSRERGRLFLSVGGVAFSIVLILLVGALYQGWNTRITQYIESIDADLWVAQKGTKDMSHSFSLLPRDLGPQLERADGVDRVYRFIGRQVSFERQGKHIDLFVVGFDTATGQGAPPKIVAGRGIPGEREIVVDRALSKREGIKVGDTLEFGPDEQWTVIGLSEGGNQVVRTYGFARMDEAERLIGVRDFSNYYLITASPGSAVEQVRQTIANQFDVRVVTKAEFVDDNRAFIRESFLPIISVLFVIAFGIGAAVVGLTIYTATIERAEEYGVLKAIGFDAGRLYRIVLVQSFLAALLGYIVGAVIAVLLSKLLYEVEPSFFTMFRVQDILLALGITVLMALLAAWAPTKRIASIDPAETFRA